MMYTFTLFTLNDEQWVEIGHTDMYADQIVPVKVSEIESFISQLRNTVAS